MSKKKLNHYYDIFVASKDHITDQIGYVYPKEREVLK